MKRQLLSLAMATIFGALIAEAEIPSPTGAPMPLTPEQTAASYRLPDGFRMEVVACEPLISSPSGVCWDERGRMFVSELHGYNLAGQLDIEELNKTGNLDTQVRRVQADEKFKKAAEIGTYGLVKLLRDGDGDGRMDKATVFADHLPPAYGLVPARGGIIVACAPDILFLADHDGDDVAEIRETLFTGFPTGELERGINAPQWSDDGWIYFGRGWGGGKITGAHLKDPVRLPDSDFRIRADGSAIEPVTGGTHTFGFAMTASGDRFVVNTTIPGIFIAPLPWHYIARNPDAATPSFEAPTGDRRAYSVSKPHPWRQKRADDPAYFKFYNSRYGAAESEADGWFTAACGPLVYRDHALPGLHGQYFVCEPSGNLIHRAVVETEGSMLKIRRAAGEEKSEFAATSDPWSHPIRLTHGPDGSIWVTDYYREIIEDYSAIPRHLQQQYGVYAGHDRGRVYRLTHRDKSRAPSADMSMLKSGELVREAASPLLWRRQTAQRLLVEKGEKSVAPELRKRLADRDAAPSATITALNTLDQLGALTPADLPPFVSHADPSLRIHALQIGDHWFAQDEGRLLLSASLAAAAIEKNPRVQIQFALSLGQCVHPEAFAMLKVYATEHMDVRWMDAAILSSLHGRAGEMLGQLLGSSGGATPTAFLALLAQAVAARRDEPELARTLRLIVAAEPSKQVVLLNALAGGRKNAPRKPLADNAGRAALATLAASEDTEVRQAARTLESTFLPAVAEEDGSLPAKRSYGPESVSEEVFGKFVSALAAPRNRQHGHEVFLKACATCHRIGAEGHELGPDLAGQIGMAEESLLKDILMPDERIRPGYETTLVLLADGSAITGILKDDGATGLTLAMPNGSEQVLLRKDTTGTRRLATSVMPSFAEGLTPVEVADLLAWLRSVFGVVEPKPAPGYYELRIYSVTSNKLDGVLERFRDTVEPVRRRHGITTIGYWIAATTDGDKFIYLMGAANAGRLKEQEQAFGGDVDFQKGYTASNARHGRTVDKIETLPLNVDTAVRFDFFASRTPRAFELRIYSVLPGKLDAFRNRWRDHAVPIYERHGLHSLGWWVTDKKGIDGNDQFAVLLAGESEDSIRQSIAAFHRDAEWQLIEKETERDGKLRSSVDAYKMRATDFSSLK